MTTYRPLLAASLPFLVPFICYCEDQESHDTPSFPLTLGNDSNSGDDDKDNGLSPLSLLAISAGIPIVAIVIAETLAIILICFLYKKRGESSRNSSNRGISSNLHKRDKSQGFVASDGEHGHFEMVENVVYQSVERENHSKAAGTGGHGLMDKRNGTLPESQYSRKIFNKKDNEIVYNEVFADPVVYESVA